MTCQTDTCHRVSASTTIRLCVYLCETSVRLCIDCAAECENRGDDDDDDAGDGSAEDAEVIIVEMECGNVKVFG